MKNLFLVCLFACLFSALSAQSYDISQYKARFDRRPMMELRPHLNYNGLFSNDENSERHGGGMGFYFNWAEQQNTDRQIKTFGVNTQAGFSRQEYADHDQVDRNSAAFRLSANYDRTTYVTAKRFWGVRGSFQFSAEEQSDLFGNSDRRTNLSFHPGVYFGNGRIEYAEDALLANWIMDDLIAADAIAAAGPESRFALAQRITSIIGNRTFDFRRRRIFELEQLKNLFIEQGVTVNDDFTLFAILNDNWVFANRASLPHGRRWQIGLDVGGDYGFASLPSKRTNFLVSGQPYISYEHATIKGNNAAAVWSIRLKANGIENVEEDVDFPTGFYDQAYGANLVLGHELIWLPTSRTTLSWENTLAGGFFHQKTFFGETLKDRIILGSSTLSWNYFVNNNWQFQLSAGVNGQYREIFTNNYSVNPYLSFSTQYFIF